MQWSKVLLRIAVGLPNILLNFLSQKILHEIYLRKFFMIFLTKWSSWKFMGEIEASGKLGQFCFMNIIFWKIELKLTILRFRIRPQKFLVFIFNPFSTYSTSLKYWTWAMTMPPKNLLFWSNPSKIKFMITAFIEMLELRNFVHMIILSRWFELCDKIFLMRP